MTHPYEQMQCSTIEKKQIRSTHKKWVKEPLGRGAKLQPHDNRHCLSTTQFLCTRRLPPERSFCQGELRSSTLVGLLNEVQRPFGGDKPDNL